MSKKDIIELIITIVLLVVLVVVLPGALKPRKQPPAVKIPQVSGAAATSHLPAQSGAARFAIMENEGHKHAVGRDPFTAAPIVAQEEKTGFQLTGIIWDKNKPMAIINDSVVGEGETVNNCRVVAIKKDRVILNDGQKDIELLLVGDGSP